MKMDIGNICGKLRRLSSSHTFTSKKPPPFSSFAGTLAPSHPDLSANSPPCASPSSSSPNESSSFSIRSPSIPQSSQSHANVKLLKPQSQCFRLSSVWESRNNPRLNRRRWKTEQVMELIRSCTDDLRLKLDVLNVRLPVSSLVHIFLSMNAEKIPAFEFFDWVRAASPEHARDPDICSLAVDNCGRLDDYSAMVALLKEFSLKGVCLNRNAFGFLNVLASSKTSVKDSVRNMVDVLKEVGGSCLVSGVCGLIEMFSSLGSVDIVKYIIEITEQKVSHYNIVVKEMCGRCDFQGVKDLLVEMRQLGCNPNEITYNYFISSLCRNNQIKEAREVLEEMQRLNCAPNAVTFEILICYYLRKTREANIALELLDQMVVMGIEPRLTTDAAFIKAYFSSGQIEEAYKFVTSSWVPSPINVRYTLLASLYQKEGNLIEARRVLVEMMEKGLRPNSSVCRRVVRHLVKSGETDLAQELAQLMTQFDSDVG